VVVEEEEDAVVEIESRDGMRLLLLLAAVAENGI